MKNARTVRSVAKRAALTSACLYTIAACYNSESHEYVDANTPDSLEEDPADGREDPNLDPAETEGEPDAPEDSLEDATDSTDGSEDIPDDGEEECMQEEILPGIYTFAGIDPSLPDDDLAVIDTLIGDARLIGMGESVHTSGGYYAMKNRLIRHAVEDQGVRVFAMETPRTAARIIDDYIRTCEGEASDALINGAFGVFGDTHTAALIEWLCGYNDSHPSDMVKFFGFDAQQPWDDGQELEAFLSAAAPADAEALMAGIDICRIEMSEIYNLSWEFLPYPEEEFTACLEGMDDLDAYLLANEAALMSATSEENMALAHIASTSLRSWQGEQYYYDFDISQAYEWRDLAMHRIFDGLRQLYFPDARVVIWAHNWHLEMNHPVVEEPWFTDISTFGTELYRQVGDDYAPIALIGYEVRINWPGVLQPALPGSGYLETRLHELGRPYLIVDFDSSWLGDGTEYPMDMVGTLVPREQWRMGVYLDYSPAMDALGW